MKKKQMILSLALILGITMVTIPSKAVLQANPNTNGKVNGYWDDWMINARKMETKNQAMGLEETIDEATMKSTSGSNGIDVHMIKTTEWGTVAILSASGYGNPQKVHESEIKSTTGNKTGMYLGGSWEFTAGGNKQSQIAPKYFDAYEYNGSAKVGDGLGTADDMNPGCRYWHNTSVGDWINQSTNIYFMRGTANVMFSFIYGGNGGTGYREFFTSSSSMWRGILNVSKVLKIWIEIK